jgi:hypothetical protein
MTIPVTVYENEPSSVVAFALSSNEYKTKRMDMLREKAIQPSGSKAVLVLEEEALVG